MKTLFGLYVGAMILASRPLHAQGAGTKAADPLAPRKFLTGDWVGSEGKGVVASKGRFSIKPDLAGKILLRRDQTQYVDSSGKSHPLMILVAMAPREDGHSFQANYFDSDGHVLNFVSKRVVAGRSAEFISDPVADPMIFRLTYERTPKDELHISFERADVRTPTAFVVMVAGIAKRAGVQK